MIVSCSAQACRLWLGYVPASLETQLATVLNRISRTAHEQPPPSDGALVPLSSSAMLPPSPPPSSSSSSSLSTTTMNEVTPLSIELIDSFLQNVKLASSSSSSNQIVNSESNDDLWYLIEEKIGLHAAVIRYMRFDNDQDVKTSVSLLQGGIQEDKDLLLLDERRDATATSTSTLTAPPTEAPLSTPFALQALLVSRIRTREYLLSHAEAILQDVLISISDTVADAYLAETRQGREGGRLAARLNAADVLPGAAWAPLLHSRLQSTRALERFRNQVALSRGMRRHVKSVVAVYEDRFELWGVEGSDKARLVARQLPMRRAPEMAALQGWRGTLSLALEAADVVLPMLRQVGDRISSMLSFFFINLIGRSLGLIFRGVRQGLGMNSGEKVQAAADGVAPFFDLEQQPSAARPQKRDSSSSSTSSSLD